MADGATVRKILEIITALQLDAPGVLSASRPSNGLFEGWQNEIGIDHSTWAITDPATGAGWARGAIGELLMAYSSPNAIEACRLLSNYRFIVSPDLYGTNKILRKFFLEWETHVITPANLDNVTCFWGLTPAVADVRTNNNIIGFGLVGAGNALQSITDAGGAETVHTGFGENLVLTNKLKIAVSLNSVKFYVNEVEVANHIVNLPSNAPMYLNFFTPTGAGGAATIRIGTLRAWNEDLG
jgi:hypothetical protein